LAFQPFVIPLLAVNDPSAVLHPYALRNFSLQASVLQGTLGAADQFGHELFGDLVDAAGVFGFHGIGSTPRIATMFNWVTSWERFAMDNALRDVSFVSGLLLTLAGVGIAMNFFLRSKSIEIPIIALLVIGVALVVSGWKRSHRR
jgi:hypothetical protein